MAISSDYRPAIVTTAPLRVDLDSWAAGGTGSSGVTDAQGTLWRVSGIEGWWDAPDIRDSFTDRPGEHGGFDGPAFLQPRIITLSGTAVATSASSSMRSRDILASICGDPSLGLSTMVVTYPGRPTTQAAVRRSGQSRTSEISRLTFRWSILLVAPDPRRYANTLSSQGIGLAQVGSGGLVFPLVFPLTFGSGTSGGQMTLTNAGTMAAWPTWVMTGPVTGPVITNVDTGERLEFDPTFTVPAGQSMTIDTAAKTVILTGVSRRDRLFTAQWFRLRPGTTNIRFSSVSGSDPAALLTANWRDAWT